MHGVGAKYEAAAFRAFSLKPFFTTEEQVLFFITPDFVSGMLFIE